MKLNVSFVDNEIILDKSYVTAIEIENKKYFYRFVKGLFDISNNQKIDDFQFIDNEEKYFYPSLEIINNYFELDINSKKTLTELYKNIANCFDEEMIQELMKNYRQIYNSLNKILKSIDLPLSIQQEYENDLFLKSMKISISMKEELLDNLLLIIDINRLLKLHQVIIFINLKQYLTKDELTELYKYAIYNNVNVLLIDSQSYGPSIDNEHKLIIDSNLDEFML